MATKTAVIILCEEAVFIWAIPPLSPQSPDFFDHNPTHHMPSPLFTIPLPELSFHPERLKWNTIGSWYFGSSQPLYFDMLFQDSKLHRFQITLKPDLSTASVRVIDTSEITPHNFLFVYYFRKYMICEDTLVSCYIYTDYVRDQHCCGVYTGLTSPRLANGISHSDSPAKMLLPDIGHKYVLIFCPASGRFVGLDSNNRVAILDFF